MEKRSFIEENPCFAAFVIIGMGVGFFLGAGSSIFATIVTLVAGYLFGKIHAMTNEGVGIWWQVSIGIFLGAVFVNIMSDVYALSIEKTLLYPIIITAGFITGYYIRLVQDRIKIYRVKFEALLRGKSVK